ncbi:MAG: methionyl-tRNA formyltransferase [Clostridia bacterium]|nr:methionyl-tRNA formyltransferase [Clostridia bacterium]
MKIVFFGTPDIARDCLKAIYEAGHEIVLVVTVPDKPNSRGKKIVYSEVKEFAIEHNLNLVQPEKLANNEELKAEIGALNPDIFCVVAYGKYLPKSYINMCKYEPVNIHPSLLPKYRGSAPIQWAVLNGDKETGVTSMYISEKMDAGDIILQEKVQIGEYETTGELWDRLSKIGGNLLVKTLEQIENGTAPRIPQGEEYSEVTMISKDMAKIDFEKTAEEIKNLVRGLNPFLGAYGFLEGKKIKIWRAEVKELAQEYKDKQNGEIVIADDKKGLYIKLKDGLLSVLEIQGENAKRMNTLDYLRGNKIDVGNKFE